MKIAVLAAAITLALGTGAALPAFADDDDMHPARLQRLDDRAAQRGYDVSLQEAMDIARANGVVRITDVDLDDDAEWEIEGRTADGREIDIDISARDGRVLDLDIDD